MEHVDIPEGHRHPPAAHTHPMSEIVGLVAELAGKASTGDLDAKADLAALLQEISDREDADDALAASIASHTHAASAIVSGLIAQARLGSDSAGLGAKFLADDQTYKTVTVDPWTQVVNEDGTSLANWTSVAGSWAVDGTFIEQTSISASWKTLKYNTRQLLGVPYILEAEVYMVSGSGGDPRTMGLLLGWDGADQATGLRVDLRNSGGNEILEVDRAGSAILSAVYDWPGEDQFIKLKAVGSGAFVSLYVNDVFVRQTATGGATGILDFIGLATYNCESRFKNIKAWRLRLPGE